MRKELLLFIALLLIAATGAKAQYTVTLTSEYTNVPTIYAGVKNYMTLKVTNNSSTDASNVPVTVSLGEENIYNGTIVSIPAGETAILYFYDETIRPITENTIKGNNNENAVYTVSVGGAEQDFSFVILYNGFLGKDYEYPSANPLWREYTFTGDVLVLNQDVSTYMASSAPPRDDVFSVDLDGGSVYKALLYVSYNWDKAPGGDFNGWTTTFNGASISSADSYRDQGNLGSNGDKGYGLVVYDVTNKVVDGDNTFRLEKTAGNVAVYPSSLIVMVNKPSGNPKAVYILEEADLLEGGSTYKHKGADAIYNSSFADVAIGNAATLYVFAAGAQPGEGDLIVNGDVILDVWSGTSLSFDTFQTDVDPGNVSVKFVSTGSTILALHQMLVVDLVKGNEGKTGEYWATYYNGTNSCQADANTTVYTGALNGDKIALTKVTDKKIPAGNAVILKSTNPSITMTPITATGILAGNDLLGTDADLVNPGNAYCLSKSGTTVGFYKFTSGGTIPAHRAYISIPASARTFYGFGDDDTMGINDVPVNWGNEEDSILYNLTGSRVIGQPTKKGIYVRNGKKIVIK